MQDQTSNGELEQAFRFDDTTEITVLGTVDEPMFIASQVARALGYRDAANMTRRLDEDDRGTHSVSTPGGQQSVTVITEAGLYVAVLGSQIESAKAFKRWVTHTVLPEIRKTGSYGLATVATLTPLEYARKLVDAEERAEADRKRCAIAETRLAVERKHRAAIEGGDGIHLTDFGKKYFSEVPARKFDAHLYGKGWLINQKNTRVRPDGEVRDGVDHRKPTAKGRPYIYGHDQGNYGGKRRFQARVRPQMEIALRDALAAEGLPVNEHSTGLVLISNDEIRELGA